MKRRSPEALRLTLLVGLGFLGGLPFLRPFTPFLGDTWPHVVRTQVVYSELLTGFRLPTWTFFFYCGCPFLQFYSPLYYYVAGLVTLLTGGDVYTGTKWLLLFCHAASGIGMYYLAKEVYQNVNAALVGAIAYLLTAWHLCQVLLLARYPVAFFNLLFPLALLSLELLVRTGSRRHALLLATFTALLVWIHIGYAFFAILFMGVWLMARVAQSRERRSARRRLRLSACALVVALLLSSALLIPHIVESPQYRTSAARGSMQSFPVSLLEFLWTPGNEPLSHPYLGISVLVLAMVGVLEAVRSRRRQFASLAACTILALLLIVAKGRTGILDSLPLISEFPWTRFLTYFVAFLPILAAGGYLWLERSLSVRSALLACSVLIVGDLLPMSMVTVYRRSSESLGARWEVYEQTRGNGAGSRVLDLGSSLVEPFDYGRLARYPAAGFMFARYASPLGFYWQFAGAGTNYVYQWANEVGMDFQDTTNDTISTAAMSVLHLLDICTVIAPAVSRRDATNDLPARKNGLCWDALGTSSPVLPVAVCAVDNPSHVLAANIVRPWPAPRMVANSMHLVPSDWHELLDSSVVDPQTHTLRVIWSAEGMNDSLPGGSPVVAVTRLNLHHQRVELDLGVSKECYLRLPYSYFPTLQLSIDGRRAKIFRGADGFIFTRVPAGRHRLALVPTLSRVRRLSIALNLAAMLGVVALVCWSRRRRARAPTRGIQGP